MKALELRWDKLLKASSFDSELEYLRGNGGVYLWILESPIPRIVYIGQTENFFYRFMTHFSSQLGGAYFSLDVPEDQDYLDFLKENIIGKSRESLIKNDRVDWPATPKHELFSFNRYIDSGLHDLRLRFFDRITFLFCTIDSKEDRRDAETLLLEMVWEKYAALCKEKKEDFRSGFARSRDTPFGAITQGVSKEWSALEHIGPYGSKVIDILNRGK